MSGLDAATLAAIDQRAQELADAAPPLTAEQALLMASLLRRYDDTGGDAP
jgi:hypothetical protein